MTGPTQPTCPKCSAALAIESSRAYPLILCAGCGSQFRPNGDWPLTRTSHLAIASCLLGILSIAGLCLTAIPALFLGLLALREIRRPRNAEILTGTRLAITGVSLGAIFSLAMFASPLLVIIPIQRELTIDELERAAQRSVQAEDWTAAAEQYSQILELAPKNEMHWLRAATISAQADTEAYHRLCDRMLLQFEQPNPTQAERIAKACLLLPPTPTHLDKAFQSAEQAATHVTDSDLTLWFGGTRALARYRRGDFAGAIESCRKCQLGDPSDLVWVRSALVCGVESAAHASSGAADEAREALERGRALLDKNSESGASWHDVLIARLILNEAEALVNRE